MIKVKTFLSNSQNHLHIDRLDQSINDFIANNEIEVIDIKYSTCAASNGNGGISFYPSALLIYKEEDKKA